MDIYDCTEAVEYGRVDFSPEASPDSKQRTIKLPVGTPIDNVIRTCFAKRRGPHVHPPKQTMADQLKNAPPDTVTKIQNDGAMKVLKDMCEAKGIVVDPEWDAARFQLELENYVAPPVGTVTETTEDSDKADTPPAKVLPEDIDRLNKDALQAACTERLIDFVEEDTKAELREKLKDWMTVPAGE